MRAIAKVDAATEKEHLDGNLSALFRDGKNVCVANMLQTTAGSGLNRIRRLNSLSQDRGACELQIGAGPIPCGAQGCLDFLPAATKETPQVFDEVGIFRISDLPDTGGRTAADLILETWSVTHLKFSIGTSA